MLSPTSTCRTSRHLRGVPQAPEGPGGGHLRRLRASRGRTACTVSARASDKLPLASQHLWASAQAFFSDPGWFDFLYGLSRGPSNIFWVFLPHHSRFFSGGGRVSLFASMPQTPGTLLELVALGAPIRKGWRDANPIPQICPGIVKYMNSTAQKSPLRTKFPAYAKALLTTRCYEFRWERPKHGGWAEVAI